MDKSVTDAEKLTINVKTAIGILVAVAMGVSTAVVFQVTIKMQVDSLSEQLKDVKQDIKTFRIGEIQTKLDTLQTKGSDGLQKLGEDMAVFRNAVESFRISGSPGEVKRMDNLESRVSILEREFEVHQLKEERKTSKP